MRQAADALESMMREKDAMRHDFDRLAERENHYVNESERFREALIGVRAVLRRYDGDLNDLADASKNIDAALDMTLDKGR
jgi:hypothetical protein